jgi:molybdopterin-guanine dinucleotide biosynthesis protein MobB
LKIIHFFGYSNSGKTQAISFLTKELARKGKRVGILKHIHESFSLDRKGKDTWLFRKSGASPVIAISPSKFFVMKNSRGELGKDLEEALRIFRTNGTEYMFIEGFHSMPKGKPRIKEIVCASKKNDALKLLREHRQPLCVLVKAGNFRADKRFRGVPILNLPKDKKRLMQLIF